MGKRLRVKTDGTQIHKIHLKEEERKNVEPKLEALALLYKKLTNKIVTFEFVKTLAEEKKRKKKKERKEGKKEGKKEAVKEEEAKEA